MPIETLAVRGLIGTAVGDLEHPWMILLTIFDFTSTLSSSHTFESMCNIVPWYLST